MIECAVVGAGAGPPGRPPAVDVAVLAAAGCVIHRREQGDVVGELLEEAAGVVDAAVCADVDAEMDRKGNGKRGAEVVDDADDLAGAVEAGCGVGSFPDGDAQVGPGDPVVGGVAGEVVDRGVEGDTGAGPRTLEPAERIGM